MIMNINLILKEEQMNKKEKIVKYLGSPEIESRLTTLLAGDKKKADKFKSALLNIALDRSLASATPESIIKSALSIAEIGLPLSKNLGLAYIVSYKREAQPIISYKGWKELLRRSGIIVKERVVYDVDTFNVEYDGFDERFILLPNMRQRKEGDPKWVEKHLKGVWVAVKFDNGEVQNWFVDRGKIEQLAAMSPALKAKKGHSPYETGWILEMYMAKAVGWVARRIGVNSETLEKAFEIENSISELPKIESESEDIFDIDIVAADDIDKEPEQTGSKDKNLFEGDKND